MGAGLVKVAYAYACDVPLTPNEFRLLAFMALTAMDREENPRYFDSREASALGLGRRIVDEGEGSEDEKRERAAALEAVKVAIRGLINVGAIARIREGRSGQRAEYGLILSVSHSRSTLEYRRREGRTFQGKKVPPSPNRRATLPGSEGSAFPQGSTQETQGLTAGDTALQPDHPLAATGSILQAVDTLVDQGLPVEGLLTDGDALSVLPAVLDGDSSTDRNADNRDRDSRTEAHQHPSLHGAQRTGRTA